MVEYNTCDLCKVQEEVEKLIWDNQQWENIGYKLYKKIRILFLLVFAQKQNHNEQRKGN